MRRSRFVRWLALSALAVATLLSWTAEAVPGEACAGNPGKCYSFSVEVDPATPLPGDNATYTFTMLNLSKGGGGVQLGSANVTWSPSDAFWRVTPVSVSTGTINVADGVIELRDLSTPPGSSVTFVVEALALEAGDVTFTSTAKQANRYSGKGNDLSQVDEDPSVAVSGNCDPGVEFEAYGCGAVDKVAGGTICTGTSTSVGGTSAVRSCITFPSGIQPAAGSSPIQLMSLRTTQGGEECPVVIECPFVVQLMRKLDGEYQGAAASATLTIYCGALCSDLPIYFQEDETSGIKELLPPCVEETGPIPSPLTGSLACFTDNGDGTVTVLYVTTLNDWKVMS